MTRVTTREALTTSASHQHEDCIALLLPGVALMDGCADCAWGSPSPIIHEDTLLVGSIAGIIELALLASSFSSRACSTAELVDWRQDL
mmetsp:Transcript_31289/g.62596  ORF Transcript_31289/g.62596 Transcript_31289/m.62596 type:complete len:88 (-) Transcript_31289:291-554(-)